MRVVVLGALILEYDPERVEIVVLEDREGYAAWVERPAIPMNSTFREWTRFVAERGPN